MKLSEKRRKSVSFETKDILEKTSENMERMTALMGQNVYKARTERHAL